MRNRAFAPAEMFPAGTRDLLKKTTHLLRSMGCHVRAKEIEEVRREGGKIPLLSFPDSQAAGEAMRQHWQDKCKGSDVPPPPFEAKDAAWADLFRAGYEAIR